MFTTFIYQPLLNILVFLYATIARYDLGIAIILITLLVRTVLMPLSLKAARSQQELARIAPLVKAIQERTKGNTSAQSEALMALYREHHINPLSSFGSLLVQIPILLGLYKVFNNIFTPEALALLYWFVPHPSVIDPATLGGLMMSTPSHILAVLAGGTQFFQARIALAGQPKATGMAATMNQQMLYMVPLMVIVIGWRLPAGLALYWVITALFSIGEQFFIRRSTSVQSAIAESR